MCAVGERLPPVRIAGIFCQSEISIDSLEGGDAGRSDRVPEAGHSAALVDAHDARLAWLDGEDLGLGGSRQLGDALLGLGYLLEQLFALESLGRVE